MNYTLITPTGKIYTFYILGLAETYQRAYGGTVLDAAVFTPTAGKVISESALR